MKPGDEVLVLGATGTVGAAVVAGLRARGLRVRGATRDPAAAARSVGPGPVDGDPTWVRFDLERPETFRPALRGVSAVFMVARPGDDDADRPARALLDVMLEEDVEHVVDLSAMGAELREDFALRRIERMLEASGLGWTHLRPNWFMQVFGGGALRAGIRAGVLSLPAGAARVSYIDARDIAAVAAAALAEPEAHAGRAYTLTGGEALDHDEVAHELALAANRAIRYHPIEEAQAHAALAAAGFGAARVERLVGFYRLVRAGACAPVSPHVERVLQRRPTSFAAFVADNAELWSDPGAPALAAAAR